MQKTNERTTGRKAIMHARLFTLILIAMLAYVPGSSAMIGGTLLTSRQERIGITRLV